MKLQCLSFFAPHCQPFWTARLLPMPGDQILRAGHKEGFVVGLVVCCSGFSGGKPETPNRILFPVELLLALQQGSEQHAVSTMSVGHMSLLLTCGM